MAKTLPDPLQNLHAKDQIGWKFSRIAPPDRDVLSALLDTLQNVDKIGHGP